MYQKYILQIVVVKDDQRRKIRVIVNGDQAKVEEMLLVAGRGGKIFVEVQGNGDATIKKIREMVLQNRERWYPVYGFEG